MKVQYLGDVNDYRKYALLRLLAGVGLKLGVHWLLTANDGRSDGGKRGYLAQSEIWRPYDPDLFDLLVHVPPAPTLDDFRQIERRGIIPGAVYFERIVVPGLAAREKLHATSMDMFAACDLVFFDPDNGLATGSVSKNQSTGVKFVFDDELAGHYQAGRSLLIYQHFPRVERANYIQALGQRLRDFASDAEIWACHTSHVVFMLVANPSRPADHIDKIATAVDDGQSRWPAAFINFKYIPRG